LFRGQLLARRGIHSFSASFFLNVILIAPPVEEMIFRGIIFQQFAQKLPFWQVNLSSSVIFTIYHIPLWLARNHGLDLATILWVLTASTLFGWIFWKTKSLGAGTIVHSLHNLFLKMLM
jgi:membrane protease YdiL (CAAX protease family)